MEASSVGSGGLASASSNQQVAKSEVEFASCGLARGNEGGEGGQRQCVFQRQCVLSVVVPHLLEH